MNNNITNQQLLKDKFFLEKVFLLNIESRPEKSASVTEATEKNLARPQIDARNTVKNPQTKAVATSLNPLSIYALVVTLLLLFPSNRDHVNSKTVEVDREQKQIELLQAQLQQLELKTEILAVGIATEGEQPSLAVESSSKLPVVNETNSTTTVEAAESTPAVTVSESQLNSQQLPIYQLPALPIPTPPPPTIQPLWSVNVAEEQAISPLVNQPLLLTVPSLPSFPNSLQPESETRSAKFTAPPLLMETNTETSITPATQQAPQPIQQWLGQTDLVYFSHSFGRQEQAKVESSSDVSVSTVQQQDDRDLSQYLTSTQRAETQLEQNSSEADLAENATLIATSLPDHDQRSERKGDSVRLMRPSLHGGVISDSSIEQKLVPTSELEQTSSQPLMVDSEELDLALYLDSPVEEQSQLQTESAAALPSLFNDDDLARYLNTSSLLDDRVVQQALGTSATAIVNSVETVATNTSEPTQELKVESTMQPNSTSTAVEQSEAQLTLFADEDLKQYLTSTPLFSDKVLKQKLQ